MKVYREIGGTTLLVFYLGGRLAEWSATKPGRLTPKKGETIHWNGSLGEFRGRSGRLG